MTIKFANNISTTLALGAGIAATSFDVASTTGFPTLGVGDYFYGTLSNTLGAIEIVQVTSWAGTTVTCTRGAEGTPPAAWSTGDSFEIRITAAGLTTVLNATEVVEEVQTATSGQTVFTLTTFMYVPGENTLSVYVDGVNQIVDLSYTETGTTTVTFIAGLHLGALVKFTTLRTSGLTTSAAVVTYEPAGTGAVATTVQTKLRESVSVLDFGAVGDGITDDTAAIQAAILASVGITALSSQPTGCLFAVELMGNHRVSTIYLPRYTDLRGAYTRCRLNTVSNAPVLVLGRSLAENDWVDVTLRDFQIYGTLTGSSQVGIKGAFTGAGGYIAGLHFDNIYIRDMGGSGMHFASDNAAGMMLYTVFNNVKCVNSNNYGLYININVFNLSLFTNCAFEENLLGGVLIDYFGSGTSPSETIKFQSCSFEANGSIIGGVQTGLGAFGFKSLMYEGHYEFDNCYFEGNGSNGADTTGSQIYVTAPWMLRVTNCLLATSNNQIIIKSGGNAVVDGNFINSPSLTPIFTFDGAPYGSAQSYVQLGLNKWGDTYTAAQLVRILNSATTTLLGYQGSTTNYLYTPPRTKSVTLRDVTTKTANTGAIGYSAVKRLANNSGGSTTIPSGALASICKNTVNSLVIITDNFSGESALYWLGPFPAILISQAKTVFTATAATALKINVYYDAGSASFVAQNNTAGSAYLSVRFVGCESMLNADDGYYATQYMEQ